MQSFPLIAVLKWALVTGAATSAILTAPLDGIVPHSQPRVGDRSSAVRASAISSYDCAPEPVPLGVRPAVLPGPSSAAAAQVNFSRQLETIHRRQLRWTP